MNDLDFDELDTAVNSLVSKNQPKDESVKVQEIKDKKESEREPEQPQGRLEETHKLEQPVNLGTNLSTNVQVATTKRPVHLMAKPSVAPAMARASRRGFIDIMAPKPAPKVPPRTGVTVMPPRVREEAVRQPVAVTAHEPLVPQPPDPVFNTEKPIETPAAVPVSSTPFVNTDKIEKRPLGAYSGVVPQTLEPEEVKVSPELSPDMLAVESGEPMTSAPEAAPTAHNKSVEQNHAARPNAKTLQPNMAPKTMDGFRPVYDVKDNPPLITAKVESKKMKLWLKILIFLIILALLGVGGYFAYVLLMPTTSTP